MSASLICCHPDAVLTPVESLNSGIVVFTVAQKLGSSPWLRLLGPPLIQHGSQQPEPQTSWSPSLIA